jgi:hypothetical protein
MRWEMSKFLICGNAGWCHFKIGEFDGVASYLTDVPLDFINAFIDYCNNGNPPTVKCDSEGTEFIVVVDIFSVFIIETKDKPRLYEFKIDRDEFINQVLEDIKTQENDWCNFLFSTPDWELKSQIYLLEKLLKTYNKR